MDEDFFIREFTTPEGKKFRLYRSHYDERYIIYYYERGRWNQNVLVPYGITELIDYYEKKLT